MRRPGDVSPARGCTARLDEAAAWLDRLSESKGDDPGPDFELWQRDHRNWWALAWLEAHLADVDRRPNASAHDDMGHPWSAGGWRSAVAILLGLAILLGAIAVTS